MVECPKCGSTEIDVRYKHIGQTVYWAEHQTIRNIENFTKNDRYYVSDTITKECLIYVCKICDFKIALKTKDSK